MTDDEAAAIVDRAIRDETPVFVTDDVAPAEQPYTPVYEIRVRFHGLNPKPGMMTLEGPADIGQARGLACRWANGLVQPGGTIPAEVLIVGEYGPVDRWLDGHRAALESLTPCHPGGCTCGECCSRWDHLEGDPRHQPCAHDKCPVCDFCDFCEWDAIGRQQQQFAEARMTTVGDSVEVALPGIRETLAAIQDIGREIRHTEMDIDGLRWNDLAAAEAKLTQAGQLLEDVARIVELSQLRTKVHPDWKADQ